MFSLLQSLLPLALRANSYYHFPRTNKGSGKCGRYMDVEGVAAVTFLCETSVSI